jgi:hypothetical protein
MSDAPIANLFLIIRVSEAPRFLRRARYVTPASSARPGANSRIR